MATPFLSEIKICSFGFAPKGWAQCNGQLMPINQNQALFSLLGTTYGGDGRVNFGIPDLRGRTAMSMGGGHTLGERAGEVSHTLTIQELPTHVHTASASNTAGADAVPTNKLLANSPALIYAPPSNVTTLLPATVGNTGGSQPHLNQQPYLVLNFCIALQGIFPSQN
jgi:microcystin-dependent protein